MCTVKSVKNSDGRIYKTVTHTNLATRILRGKRARKNLSGGWVGSHSCAKPRPKWCAASPGVPVAGVSLRDRLAPLLTAISRARFGSGATRGGTLVAARHRSGGDWASLSERNKPQVRARYRTQP